MDNEKRTARPFVLIECVGKHHSKRYNKSKYGLTHLEDTVGIHPDITPNHEQIDEKQYLQLVHE